MKTISLLILPLFAFAQDTIINFPQIPSDRLDLTTGDSIPEFSTYSLPYQIIMPQAKEDIFVLAPGFGDITITEPKNPITVVEEKNYNCVPFESFTDWKVVSKTKKSICELFMIGHDWVYAERRDVNESSPIVIAIYCHCGCPETENQARICRKCKQHETRIRTHGFKAVEPERSEYKKLLDGEDPR